jgi:hypothetical protein
MSENCVPSAPTLNGNTNQGSRDVKASKINACKRWCFTYNNYPASACQVLQDLFNNICLKYKFQEEKGENGTPHLQGAIWLKKKARWTEFKLDKAIHWEAMRNEEASSKYCCKIETRAGKMFSMGFPVEVKTISELRPFQKSLKDILTGEVEEGAIHWVFDEKGQIGKTDFMRYMFTHHKVPFAYGGKCSDIMNLVFNNKEHFLNTNKGAMIFNFGRETEMDKVSYKALEQISDGAIYNSKFEAGCFVCNKPHVLVLANSMPITTKITASRWRFYTVNDKWELIKYNHLEDS